MEVNKTAYVATYMDKIMKVFFDKSECEKHCDKFHYVMHEVDIKNAVEAYVGDYLL